jgi:hypothetical protein
MLGHPSPLATGEVGFLERSGGYSSSPGGVSDSEDVARIDNVLIHPNRTPLHWCAVEIQAVYFSGSSMSKEFNMLRPRRSVALSLVWISLLHFKPQTCKLRGICATGRIKGGRIDTHHPSLPTGTTVKTVKMMDH